MFVTSLLTQRFRNKAEFKRTLESLTLTRSLEYLFISCRDQALAPGRDSLISDNFEQNKMTQKEINNQNHIQSPIKIFSIHLLVQELVHLP